MNSLNPVRVQRKVDGAVERRSGSKPILESHLDLLREGTFSDVTFIVGPSKERIPCHQLFLKARSTVFQVMFSERWDHNKSKEVLFDDVDPQIFRKFLEFIYSDIFVANVSEALKLLQLALKYNVQLLVGKCEKLLESAVTLDDAVDVFQAARKYAKAPLMDKVGDLMAKSLPKLQSLPSFSRVDQQTLMYILERNDLNVKEVDLFRLAVQWARSQPGLTVQQSLEDILPLIRFPIMTLKEFTTTVVPTGLLSQATLVELFTYFGTDAETKKSMASTLKFSTQRRIVTNQVRDPPSLSDPLYPKDFADCNITHQKYTKGNKLTKKSLGISPMFRSEQQRQPIDSIISLALYPRDLQGAAIVRASFRQIKESLHFSINCDGHQSQLSFGRSSMKQRTAVYHGGFGLNGVSFYCPAKIKGFGLVSSPFEEFKIRVQGESLEPRDAVQAFGDAPFKELFRLSPVRAEEGKITEVIFDTVIPLKNAMNYFVSVEASGTLTTAHEYGSIGTYDARHFGSLQRRATVEVGDTQFVLENIQKNSTGAAWGNQGLQPQLILKLSFQLL